MYHSPLQRARDTARGLFPSSQFIELDFLREEAPLEILTFSSGVDKRIRQLHDWLTNHDAETIFLVGHSRYFRRMTQMDRVIDNCSILKCTFDSSNDINKWMVHEILYCLDGSYDCEYLGKTNLEESEDNIDNTTMYIPPSNSGKEIKPK